MSLVPRPMRAPRRERSPWARRAAPHAGTRSPTRSRIWAVTPPTSCIDLVVRAQRTGLRMCRAPRRTNRRRDGGWRRQSESRIRYLTAVRSWTARRWVPVSAVDQPDLGRRALRPDRRSRSRVRSRRSSEASSAAAPARTPCTASLDSTPQLRNPTIPPALVALNQHTSLRSVRAQRHIDSIGNTLGPGHRGQRL